MIELELQGNTALVTLSRPPANAFSLEGLRQLRQTIHDLNANAAVRALVITGSGPKFFSAGADLNTFADGDRAKALDMIQAFGAAFEALANSRLVTVAAINGYAMGGGLECALATDIRVAEQHAQLALPEASVGLLPGGTGTQTLPWLVGEAWAKRMILLGERVDAATALRIGLVEEVVDSGKALERALALAERVGSQSPDSVLACKDLIHAARNGVPRAAALAQERERFMGLFNHPNQLEGVNAFLQKRKATWQ
ncbi:MAG: enoyl-CoA hydratase [Aquabacterium sp.]|uniref:enoyl-CoA hydratase n=1 Tax=Aquabacterium sp. TaxID=1872578 RepID=UPI00271C3A3A|nr:enoyl-CoA hydratase [Aquabacterium sp.]MDO9003969.1 enoyl-CoA hydratase [Aquabacterium sp.]